MDFKQWCETDYISSNIEKARKEMEQVTGITPNTFVFSDVALAFMEKRKKDFILKNNETNYQYLCDLIIDSYKKKLASKKIITVDKYIFDTSDKPSLNIPKFIKSEWNKKMWGTW